ncbi:neuromedin B [Rhinolophus ferrumequinum]|uniref:Neuromedin B n=1 Tax=Rhinolophus ferrumequinum TaxID=59479 RepID=A0A671FYA8_RHIFE|nr:neuromedin-B isoform X2 [Rhinolophus ferrumequinum]KAF6273308.1 neuromedin B [Rhinolophus ferrumequinum]
MALRAEGARWISGLLLFAMLTASAARLSWDLPDPRSLASKIRVHPRGNLWATGHFMGKKSLEPPSPSLLGTAPQISLRDQRLQLSHDLLRILLLKKTLGTRLIAPAPHTQEAAGAKAAEVKRLMRKIRQRGLDCAHPGPVLNGTLVVAPSGCKSWAQISVTPIL